MIFIESKNEGGFTYTVKDIFGKVEIYSPERLEKEKLDEVFVAIFNKGKSGKGEVKGTNITYNFLKKSQWVKTKEKPSKKSTK